MYFYKSIFKNAFINLFKGLVVWAGYKFAPAESPANPLFMGVLGCFEQRATFQNS